MSALPRVFALLDTTHDVGLLPDLVRVGVLGFQVRAKQATDRDLLALVGRVLELVRPLGATVIVNDRADVALVAGADGVHLGVQDLPVAAVRRIAPGLLIGATCRDRSQVERARAQGADYAGFGPVYTTATKAGLPAPRTPDGVRAAVGLLPLVGIGGLDASNAAAVIAAGADSVATVSGIWGARDPVARAEELVAAVA